MKYPWIPLYCGDFLANTLHLTAAEVGAYFLLIAHAWENDGWIPYDRAQRIARMDNRHWAKARARLEEFFTLEQATEAVPRRYCHGRVSRELAKAAEKSNQNKDAALRMHSKRRANAYAKRHAKSMRSTTTVNLKSDGEARSLASALPTGALAPSPSNDLNDPAREDVKALFAIPDKHR